MKCKFCAEEILDDVKKCKSCGEWLKPLKRRITISEIGWILVIGIIFYVLYAIASVPIRIAKEEIKQEQEIERAKTDIRMGQ